MIQKLSIIPESPTAKAKARIDAAEALLTGDRRTYLVNYRVKDRLSPKGSRSERYDALVAGIEALDGKETHLATSAWVVRSKHAKGSALRDLLAEPLDKSLDFLSVAQIGAIHVFGDAKLEGGQ